MVMAVYEEERRRVERNMLALSNLNLATSSFVGGEIQKMLAQALDRVLNVVRIPAGALCLHYGDSEGPTSVVVTGMGDAFCSAAQQDDLDEYIVNLVARLGGLVVLRNLASDSDYRSARKRRTVPARAQAACSNRDFAPSSESACRPRNACSACSCSARPTTAISPQPSCGLLLALGHQIGMAVENSYLIQQTARRSEELHILNEIGRALSSTLEPDILFERIYSRNAPAARRQQLFHRFLRRQSRRSALRNRSVGRRTATQTHAPAGKSPGRVRRARRGSRCLIRDHFHDETARLGFEPAREAGSICVVPLILYDRAIGVMAVHSPNERAFDEGHVELLRVLSSEAGIAIENARLFAEEQKKSRHLTLVNNISSHAITTLNPDEMLAKIAVGN